jgi:integrase
MVKLTDSNVSTLPVKGKDVLYPDDACENFYLRVRESGSRTYCIQWRQGGLQRRATIGKASHLALDEARQRARKLLVGVHDGIDPIAQKAQTRVDDRQLFSVMAAEYLDFRSRDLRARSLVLCRLHLETYFKPLHRLPLHRINRATVAAELRVIAKDRGPVAANRGRSTLSAFFGWAIGEGVIETNAAVGTNRAAESARERVLSDAELVAIWNAAPDSDYGRIIQLLLLTGQRREEIGSLRWSEIVDGVIALPRERTKNKQAHTVPLSPQALAVLEKAPRRKDREFVFGEGANGFAGYGRGKIRLDEASGVQNWTVHDLRRTMATRMADLGVQPHVIEATLNHISDHKSGVAGVYNRSSYTEEKRAAMILWGNHVRILLARATGANVATLKRAVGGVA